jgi:ABC-type transport system substrate-binding protein
VFGEPATLDPYSPLASDLTYALARPLYRSLYRFTPDGEAVPDLVRSLEASGEVATVSLVRARWSDGSSIDSSDVAATIRRAGPPSGLASIDTVTRRGPRRLILSGAVVDWPEALARISHILPQGRAGRAYSGPFVMESRVPGLEVVLGPNPAAEPQPYLDRVTVRFTEGVDFLIGLLSDGRLDAAWLPATVNLDQRLEEADLEHLARLGWERIYLDLSGSGLAEDVRRKLASALDRGRIARGLVRDLGRASDTLHPEPGPRGADGPYAGAFRGNGGGTGSTALQLSAPIGDELLELIQRVIQVQLDGAGFDVELVNVDSRRLYGQWATDPPSTGILRRAAGAPGWFPRTDPELDALPLFQVASVVASTGAVGGLAVNPTFDGPLWNAEQWYRTR